MVKKIVMPDLGTAVKEVTLISWLVQEGQAVNRGEFLCEVETDKATTELESVAQGTLLRHVVHEGSVVAVGDIIAYVGQEGETVPETEDGKEKAGEATKGAAVSETRKGAASKVSPMIRNLAGRVGIDLDQINGSGPGGQITRGDVMKAVESGDAGGQAKQAKQEIAISKNQLAVARTITRSRQEIIPIDVFGKINMSAAIALREKSLEQSGQKPSFDAIFVHAMAKVMMDFPKLRCYFEDDKLISIDEVNIGVAISIEDELFIPVINNADQKNAGQIDSELRGFVDKAGAGNLSLDELAGATLTISNLGMFAVEMFTAVIPPQQSGILTIGGIEDVVALKGDNTLTSEKVAKVILSVDHRFINGRQGAQCLTGLRECFCSFP